MGPPPPHLSSWSHLAWMGHTCVSPLHQGRERFNSQPRWPLNYSCTLGFWLRLQRGTYLSASGNAIHLNRELLRQNKKGGVPGHGQGGARAGLRIPNRTVSRPATRPGPAKTRPDPVQDPRRCVAMSWGPSLCIFSSKHPSGDKLSLPLPKR